MCPTCSALSPRTRHPAEGPGSPVGMTGVMGVEGLAQSTALGCPPASPHDASEVPGRRPALSPQSHGPHAPASRVSKGSRGPQVTDAGGWGALGSGLEAEQAGVGPGAGSPPEPTVLKDVELPRTSWGGHGGGGRELLRLWNKPSGGSSTE